MPLIPRIALIQQGPRLHYAAPAALAQHGLLQRFYTDIHADALPARWAASLLGRHAPGPVRRLLARRLPAAIPTSKVRTSAWASVELEWLSRRYPQQRKSADFVYDKGWGGHRLARLAIRDGFGGANALYAHPCVCTDAVFEAKRRGLFVILEAISYPFLRDVERAELTRLGRPIPWEDQVENNQRNITAFRREAEIADLVLAASDYVREGLLELGLESGKVRVVPYGYDPPTSDAPIEPIPGRVLFVGAVNHLKGVHYLAEAARILARRNTGIEIHVIGPSDPVIGGYPEFVGPRYVGQIPRSEVIREIRKADVFAFPTLSDGFGIVLLEAMANGVPVVSTPHCAAITIDGVNGFVVAARDAEVLADRLESIVSDRRLRERLSQAALRTATEYSLFAYSLRLSHIVKAAFERQNYDHAINQPVT